MTKLTIPAPTDYRALIAHAVQEARRAIRQTIGYIRRHEDGPVTMRHALNVIDKRVMNIQLEASFLTDENDRLRVIAAEAVEQMEEALRQRDYALSLLSDEERKQLGM